MSKVVRGELEGELIAAERAKTKYGLTYGPEMIRDWLATEGGDRSKAALIAYCEARIVEARRRTTQAVRKTSIHAANRYFAKKRKV